MGDFMKPSSVVFALTAFLLACSPVFGQTRSSESVFPVKELSPSTDGRTSTTNGSPRAKALLAAKPKGKQRPKTNAELLARNKKLRALRDSGMASFYAKVYPDAVSQFKQAVAIAPLDVGLQYYLGLSALYGDDFATGEKALSRVVVMAPPKSSFYLNALRAFETYRKQMNRVTPYSCLFDTNKIWHWSKERMPISVYISDGLVLPVGFQGKDLEPKKLNTLGHWLRKRDFVNKLSTQKHKHYRDGWATSVQNGLNLWAWATTEGFLKYGVVNDPTKASVLVFWCTDLPGDIPAKTVYSQPPGEPVIIQISVEWILKRKLHLWPAIIKSVAGHEFGHAWGLQDSGFKRDLMYPTNKIVYEETGTDQSGFNIVSQNDAATLRALYELPAVWSK